MKSSYELAMERLEKANGPTQKLNDEQKARISEIEKKYEAKSAEIRLGYEGKLASATTYPELESLQAQMASELQSCEEKRQRDKDEVWNEG